MLKMVWVMFICRWQSAKISPGQVIIIFANLNFFSRSRARPFGRSEIIATIQKHLAKYTPLFLLLKLYPEDQRQPTKCPSSQCHALSFLAGFIMFTGR